MRPKTAAALLCLALAGVGVGCSARMASWTVISTRNVALAEVDLDKMPTAHDVDGYDMKWHILGIPLGVPRIEGAVDDALSKGNGDLVTDAVLYQESRPWLLLAGQVGWRMRGNVVRTRAATSAPPVR